MSESVVCGVYFICVVPQIIFCCLFSGLYMRIACMQKLYADDTANLLLWSVLPQHNVTKRFYFNILESDAAFPTVKHAASKNCKNTRF